MYGAIGSKGDSRIYIFTLKLYFSILNFNLFDNHFWISLNFFQRAIGDLILYGILSHQIE